LVRADGAAAVARRTPEADRSAGHGAFPTVASVRWAILFSLLAAALTVGAMVVIDAIWGPQ
jgi:hypothetical protein